MQRQLLPASSAQCRNDKPAVLWRGLRADCFATLSAPTPQSRPASVVASKNARGNGFRGRAQHLAEQGDASSHQSADARWPVVAATNPTFSLRSYGRHPPNAGRATRPVLLTPQLLRPACPRLTTGQAALSRRASAVESVDGIRAEYFANRSVPVSTRLSESSQSSH